MTPIVLNNSSTTAFIDDDDMVTVSQFSWYEKVAPYTSYAVSSHRKDGVKILLYLHRFVMRAPRGTMVDHIDGNGLMCCKYNLRFATSSENHRNQRKRRGLYRYKGVRLLRGRWEAYITVNHKTRFIGSFDTDIEAALAYNREALREFGEFAFINEISMVAALASYSHLTSRQII